MCIHKYVRVCVSGCVSVPFLQTRVDPYMVSFLCAGNYLFYKHIFPGSRSDICLTIYPTDAYEINAN